MSTHHNRKCGTVFVTSAVKQSTVYLRGRDAYLPGDPLCLSLGFPPVSRGSLVRSLTWFPLADVPLPFLSLCTEARSHSCPSPQAFGGHCGNSP